MRVALIGCGAIAKKRARCLPSGWIIAAAFDGSEEESRSIVDEHGGESYWSRKDAIAAGGVVFVSTWHQYLAACAADVSKSGKPVLIEKPAAINLTALREIRKSEATIRVGYNLRYHPAIRAAKKMVDNGFLGPLLNIKAHYGHGGRPGMESEWRCNREKSGGGVLIDLGSHLIDLSNWFLRPMSLAHAHISTDFWVTEVEDNATVILAKGEKSATLTASWTEWKNTFRFEIYGMRGKLAIDGLGGSYGVERLTYWDMGKRLGVAPPAQIWEYPGTDESWALEMADFAEDIRLNRQPSCGLKEASDVLQIIEEAYSRCGREALAAA